MGIPMHSTRQPLFLLWLFLCHCLSTVAIADWTICRIVLTKAASKRFVRVSLPVSLGIESGQIKTAQQKAAGEWIKLYQDPFQVGLLDKIESEKSPDITDSDRKKLKELRRSGQVLRNVFLLLDERGKPPKAFQKYIVALGKLKDSVAYGTSSDIKKRAATVRELMHDLNETEIVQSLKPISDVECERRIQKLLNKIRKAAQHSRLPEEEFHDLRIHLRSVLDFVAVHNATAEGPSQNLPLEAFLERVNKELGAAHDKMVEEDIKAGNDSEARLKKKWRNTITEFLDEFEVGAGL